MYRFSRPLTSLPLHTVPFTPSQGIATPSPNNMAAYLFTQQHFHLVPSPPPSPVRPPVRHYFNLMSRQACAQQQRHAERLRLPYAAAKRVERLVVRWQLLTVFLGRTRLAHCLSRRPPSGDTLHTAVPLSLMYFAGISWLAALFSLIPGCYERVSLSMEKTQAGFSAHAFRPHSADFHHAASRPGDYQSYGYAPQGFLAQPLLPLGQPPSPRLGESSSPKIGSGHGSPRAYGPPSPLGYPHQVLLSTPIWYLAQPSHHHHIVQSLGVQWLVLPAPLVTQRPQIITRDTTITGGRRWALGSQATPPSSARTRPPAGSPSHRPGPVARACRAPRSGGGGMAALAALWRGAPHRKASLLPTRLHCQPTSPMSL